VQAQRGGYKVPDAVQVEDTRQGDAGDAVRGRGDPGYLPAVYGEMGGDRASEALLCEYILGGVFAYVLRSCLSVFAGNAVSTSLPSIAADMARCCSPPR
jgi:hypothetical protein